MGASPRRGHGACLIVVGLALAGCQRTPSSPSADTDASSPSEAQSTWRAPAPNAQPPAREIAGSAFEVPLTLSAPLSAPMPVRSGVPIPRGLLGSVTTLRLEQAGQALPAQFSPLVRWPDGSVKAVLVSAIVPPAAASLVLRNTPGAPAAPPPSPLVLEDASDRITVTTGPLRFSVGRKPFQLFDQAWIDRDSDGRFTDGEQLITQGGDLVLINEQGTEYRASRARHVRVTIEEAGPVAVVVRAEGELRAASGASLGRFITWITAYAGSDTVALETTLVDPREEADVDAPRKGLAFSATSYSLEVPIAIAPDGQGLFGGDPQKGVAAYAGPLSGPVAPYLYQQGVFNHLDGALHPFSFWYEGVGQGQKAQGWVDASDAQGGVAVLFRHFWEQFPKELAIDHGRVIVYFHPPRASHPGADRDPLALPGSEERRYRRPRTFYFPRVGGAKTYELLIRFHRGPGDAAALAALYDAFQTTPRLIPSAVWSCRSGVFGNLLEAGLWSQGYDAGLFTGVYNRSIEQKRGTGSYALLYGWRDYGDRLRGGWAAVANGVKIPGFYNDTHVGAHNFFIQYLRTGDERWYELGEMATRHWMDIDVSHANRLGHWKRAGKYIGYGPGEAHAIKHEMVDHDDRNVHTGHALISGLPEYYLLTGDPRAREVLDEVATWWTRAVPDFFPVPIAKRHYAEAERDFGWPLFVLNQAYRATGEQRYLEAGAQIVRHLIAWWQQPADHMVNGTRVGRNDWQQGTGWWTMYPQQDNSPAPPRGMVLYNGTNPWMAGALLGSVIQFHELDRDAHLVDDTLTEEMLLQCMNYVVKHGWNAEKRFFIYSEASRDTNGGDTHLMFPLVYLTKLLRDHPRPHPEWYDTASTWLTIAQGGADRSRRPPPGDSTELGFYGYEFFYPADFFAVMEELEHGARDPAR